MSMNKIIKLISILVILFSYSCSFNIKDEKTSNQKFDQFEYIIKNNNFVAQTRDTLPGKFIRLNDGITYYEFANANSSGPLLVLIHGFSVPSYIWEPTFQKEKDFDYRVLRFDLFGRGYSENLNTDYTDELFAKQSWELLDSLSANKVVLIGLSNGGRVISKMANINSDRIDKMIYVSSNGFNDVIELNDKSVSETEISDFIKNYKFLSQSQKNDFKNPKQFKAWGLRYSELQKYKGFAKALISTRKNHISLDNIHKEIAESDIEIYTLWGEHDTVVVFEDFEIKLNQIIPNREEFFFKNAGHLPQMESPKEFNTILFENILDFSD